MALEYPELTSFGTLMRYALTLEQGVAALMETAAGKVGGARDDLLAVAKKHTKRAEAMERLRRERLNEVVLQQISGMERETYLPEEFSETGWQELLAKTEDRVARFYEDGARVAQNVLSGLDRKFGKLARESLEFAGKLRAL